MYFFDTCRRTLGREMEMRCRFGLGAAQIEEHLQAIKAYEANTISSLEAITPYEVPLICRPNLINNSADNKHVCSVNLKNKN
ncbi:hypothetical protein C4D60_Mb07t08290 [Musa balbisiana]|uniref:Uncharacterized protein n=1 Tax=Musa balbisiana TaxID=52838 RepID=A0A4V4H6I4_MUSBA|nr:hypothetical protein C4D60_Mb07t08290 [Musa balbisiana]